VFELKQLSREGIGAALQKAERYRLLNEAWEAESICRDILQTDPSHQQALITLVLAITDQFRTEGAQRADEARQLLGQLESEYRRLYYSGIIWERLAMAQLARQTTASGQIAYDGLRRAMQSYESAERIRPEGNEEALLRWNTCARLIMRYPNIVPAPDEPAHVQLE
jgi:hypothetical protein